MKGFKREPLKKEKNTHMAQNGKKEKKKLQWFFGVVRRELFYVLSIKHKLSWSATQSQKIYLFLECEDNVSQSSWNTVTLFDSD